MRFVQFLLLLILPLGGYTQYSWTWKSLPQMPFATANNAVCEAIVEGKDYVYSFGGIDKTKIYSGIHQRSFRYDVQTRKWLEIAQLPDTLGKIAAGASFVNGKIYIIGGYHVFANDREVSSDRVHIYNPASGAFENDGAALPRAIDDHVQCVYKDSLIFVVTGWSNTSNYPDVQIYNPSLDEWIEGKKVPNQNSFTVFGASGYIIGDTLYYHGGVAGNFNFTARNHLRKGYINPEDPTDITWELIGEAPGDPGYRAACSSAGTTVFWIGGAATAYNYNGVAYDGSGGVEPSTRIMHFNNHNYQYRDEISEPIGIMDLRGIAKLSNGRWIICGGMDSGQVVSNQTYLLENKTLNVNQQPTNSGLIEVRYSSQGITAILKSPSEMRLIDVTGRLVRSWNHENQFLIPYTVAPSGVYLLQTEVGAVRLAW